MRCYSVLKVEIRSCRVQRFCNRRDLPAQFGKLRLPKVLRADVADRLGSGHWLKALSFRDATRTVDFRVGVLFLRFSEQPTC